MEIKKYIKSKFKVGQINVMDDKDGLEFFENKLISCEFKVITFNNNIITFEQDGDLFYEIEIDAQSILKLMTWLVGQEEHKRREIVHDEKQVEEQRNKMIESGIIPMSFSDIEKKYPNIEVNQKIVVELENRIRELTSLLDSNHQRDVPIDAQYYTNLKNEFNDILKVAKNIKNL